MAGIPDEIRALAEIQPVEDLVLAILREGLPGIEVKTLIANDQQFPFVLVRKVTLFGEAEPNPRLVETSSVAIHTFVEDPNGDEDSALLSEAVRVVLRNAWRSQKVVPGRGHISRLEVATPARRVTDWATAAGPVQYADLPTGIWRYESVFEIEHRPARTPSNNP
jgi:hypothetical protein